MSNSDNNFDTQLSSHYNKHKHQFKAPIEHKKHVLQKAKRIDKEVTQNINFNWFTSGALAASILVLTYFVLMPQSINHIPVIAQSTYIEYHTLDMPQEGYSRALAYAALEKEYAKKQMLTAISRKPARLEINDDGTWDLETCEDEVIQISKQLVAMLQKYDVLNSPFDSGVMVAVSFNSDGHITRIDQLESPKVC